ncbi:rhomboid intramembrane serine protease [Escherichia coli]|nr:rhomboid intramembrane serine protease [Escherichia coli]
MACIIAVSFFAALRERAGPVTWVMMIACVVVFIAMQILGDQEVMLWLAWPFDPTLKFEFLALLHPRVNALLADAYPL